MEHYESLMRGCHGDKDFDRQPRKWPSGDLCLKVIIFLVIFHIQILLEQLFLQLNNSLKATKCSKC